MPAHYEVGHGLIVINGQERQLCIVRKAAKASVQVIPITWLTPTDNELKYTEGSNGRCQRNTVIAGFSYTKQRGFFLLTKTLFNTDEFQDSGSDNSEEFSAKPTKRKRPRVSKASMEDGHPSGMPDTPVETTLMWDRRPQALLGSSLSVNNKNFHRAVLTSNRSLLENLLTTKHQLSRVNDYWSPDWQFTPLMIAICKGDEPFIRSLIRELNNHTLQRGHDPKPLLKAVDTGYVSDRTFGVKVRPVQMSRGAREGNNAFLMDQKHPPETVEAICRREDLKRVVQKGIEPNTLDLLSALIPSFEQSVAQCIGDAVRSGHLPMALHLINKFNKRGGFGLNTLHEQVLHSGKLSPFKNSLISKKVWENYRMTPLHVACINPDTQPLNELLARCEDIRQTDSSGRLTIHYAAACISDAPIKVLKSYRFSVDECDKDKITPLMISAMYNRLASATEILKTSAKISSKSKEGLAPIHYAVIHGSVEIVNLLVNAGADFNQPGAEGQTPLMYAAKHGQFNCVEALVQAGATVNKRDRRRRTALLFAVKNGFAKETWFLLRHGADCALADSSSNFPLHYAAAYGWTQCLDLLLLAGANVNCANDWNLQPLLVAILKCQTDCVTRLLQEPNIDVNCKDEQGRTLLSQAIDRLSETTLEQIKYLIHEKHADPNIPNSHGQSTLHFLAAQHKPLCSEPEFSVEERRLWEISAAQHQVDALDLLVQTGGAHINAVCKLGKTPVYYALESKNPTLVQGLMKLGADLTVQLADGSGILHSLCDLDHDLFTVFRSILQDPRVTEACIHQVDAEGLNPFLSFIKVFVDNKRSARQAIFHRIQSEAQEDSKSVQRFSDQPLLSQRAEEEFELLVRDFIDLLQELVKCGCDCHAVVDKLKRYREHPELVYQEANNCVLSSVEKFFIDADGNKKWKEYNDLGLQNALHLLATDCHETVLTYLLSMNIDLDQQDFFGFTPLARFLSRGAGYTPTLLMHGANPNIPNYQRKTPLHIAVASRNLEAVRELCVAGANPHFADYRQRTPLHIAFNGADDSFELESVLLAYGADINAIDMRHRVPLHYAFVKIGGHQDMSHCDPIETVSSACCQTNLDVNVQDCWGKTPLHYAAQRGALTSTMFLLGKGAELELKDAENNTPLALAFRHVHSTYASMLIQHGACVEKAVTVTKDQATALPEGVHSMFKSAIILGWQGVAYLLLSNGYSPRQAIEEAMETGKFQLVRTLLGKVSDEAVLVQLNQQSLFHVFARTAHNVDVSVMTSICHQLSDRGVALDLSDASGRTPLHYSMNNLNSQLSRFFLENGAKLDTVDIAGDTPLSLAVKGEKILQSHDVLALALEYGADLQFRYSQDGIETTPLLNCIRYQGPPELIKFFMDHGGSVGDVDSLRRNALMYAILNNDSEIATVLIHEPNLDLEQTDIEGRTALHYVVQPFESGSYENTRILRELLKSNMNPSPADHQGRTPYFFACRQRSGRMKAEFDKAGVTEPGELDDSLSDYDLVECPDFEEEAANFMKSQPNYESMQVIKRRTEAESSLVETTVVKTCEMIKVDLSRGPFSAYLFYRMQVLHETNRNVHVLVNHWGRIGETGASQRTPFHSKEAAVNEFKKIFFKKSGNEWGQPFQPVKGKYRMVELPTECVNYQDFLQDICLETDVASQLPTATYESFVAAMHVASYREFLADYTPLDDSRLNFSNLSKQRLQEAENLLLEIADLNSCLETTEGIADQIEIKDKIYELSSRYYELLPYKPTTDGQIPPILGTHSIKTASLYLDSVKNIEVSSKIVLGALWNRLNINPVDYLLACLPVRITPLDSSHSEFAVITKYIQSGEGSLEKLLAIFKLNRQGEAERIRKFKDLKNRKLLWHGIKSPNLVGTLYRGLLVPPAGLLTAGCFGNGLYFASMLVKAKAATYNYSYYGKEPSKKNCVRPPSTYFLLLCEVVLGKEKEEVKPANYDRCPSGYHSVLGLGRHQPNPEESFYLNNGIEVPLGSTILRPATQCYVNNDEYVVFDHDQVRLRYLVHMRG